MEQNFKDELTSQCILRIHENAERVVKCLAELDENEVWHRPNSQLSSVANLVLHLCGNITQYAIASLGGIPDSRVRDEEFSATGGMNRSDLIAKFKMTVEKAIQTIEGAPAEELLRVRVVQGFSMTGIGIIIHVTEHLSYHTGQIAMHTKLLKDKDLGFYAGIDLNK